MKYLISLFSILIGVLMFSCETETNDNPEESNLILKEEINGLVQKGPFINGTSITISELDTALIQTGKTFSTQILDNKGRFELRQIELISQFVELKADGFYYNEIIGDVSSVQLTLYALSDLSNKNTLNVNILSHLEKSRIRYLVSQGEEFSNAKKQAEEEILYIFFINKPDLPESEMLDISKDGDDNAILLAISIIIQGGSTDAELSELLANISTDIREDGELNDPNLFEQLTVNAHLLNPGQIRENLTYRYEDMGVEATISNFEKYVEIFRDSTDYDYPGLTEYPEYGEYGENILYADNTDFKTKTPYSMAANLSVGTGLKVILTGGLWGIQILPVGPKNWTKSQYNVSDQSQVFTSTETGKDCDLKMLFTIPQISKGDTIDPPHGIITKDTILIEYYENMSEMPTKSKTIYIEDKDNK